MEESPIPVLFAKRLAFHLIWLAFQSYSKEGQLRTLRVKCSHKVTYIFSYSWLQSFETETFKKYLSADQWFLLAIFFGRGIR